MSKLFDQLNKAQAEAVKCINGPSLVIAGAGSGKTRVLTYRVAFLLEKGVPPGNILALTFTNKAAREMKERIVHLLGNDGARFLWMGTFHSMFARILRKEADKLGYPSAFSIYDTDDSKSLIKSIIREMQLDEKIYKPGEVFGRISAAKNNLITPQAYLSNNQFRERDKITRRPMLGEIFKTYAIRCRKAGAMDFDDLLLNTNILFRDFRDTLLNYQEKFRYILVDEYQDTNYAQYLIVNRLGEKYKNVCVVGDDAQSIYSFRGAKIENILNFKNDYPEYKLFKLEQNYRSTQNIVNAGNSIIGHNKNQIRKEVFSKNEDGEKIHVLKAYTDVEEGFIISNAILDHRLSEQLQYSDFAILYRTNAQSRIFEESLRKRNIPYRVYGSISFYQRKEIKDVVAYLRLIVNPKDDEAFRRIINYPARGIGKTTLEKLEELANKDDITLWESSNNAALKINRGTAEKINQFRNFILTCREKAANSDAFEIAKYVVTASGIMQELRNGTMPEEISKYENLEELLNGIQDFVEISKEQGEPYSLADYLQNIALLTDADTDKDTDRDKVSIMTMHAAKGLEFGIVFIAGVEEELFPSPMAVETIHELEEERRLFYVAVTRAKKKVFITYSQSRYRWGELTSCTPSRFIRDIETAYLDWPDDPSKDMFVFDREDIKTIRFKAEEQDTVLPLTRRRLIPVDNRIKTTGAAGLTHETSFTPSDPMKIQTGMVVEHTRFGEGKVIAVEGEMPNRKATVFFREMKQEKQLLLKFAKLRIIEPH